MVEFGFKTTRRQSGAAAAAVLGNITNAMRSGRGRGTGRREGGLAVLSIDAVETVRLIERLLLGAGGTPCYALAVNAA